jgi:hypothetical protein
MLLLQEIYFKEARNNNDIWYHGTPDVRALEKEGGFTERTQNIEYISNPKKYMKIQDQLKAAHENDNMKKYYSLMDKVGELRKSFTMKSPVFLTDKFNVARTYADPKRAFDYQGAQEKILKVKVESGNSVRIDAPGDRFRFIDTDKVKQGFINAGVPEKEFDEALSMFNFYVRNNKGIKTDVVGAIGQWFGFDIIDVTGVLDSYHGGSVRSTVRMVFDPSRIKIIN